MQSTERDEFSPVVTSIKKQRCIGLVSPGLEGSGLGVGLVLGLGVGLALELGAELALELGVGSA